MTDYRALCAELLNGLDEQQHPDYPWPGYTLAAMDRARTALAQSQSEQGGDPLESFISQCRPLDDETAALLTPDVRWRLYDESGDPTPQPEPAGELPDSYIDPGHSDADRELLEAFYLAARSEGGTADEIHLRGIQAAIALAIRRAPVQRVTDHWTPTPPMARMQPQTVTLADVEVAELVAALRDPCIAPLLRERTRAADLLQHHQPPQPVAVGERLPGPEDCDGEGRCWWEFAGSDEFGPSWTLVKMHGIPSDMTRWLPVWVNALPLPTPPEAGA
jgi:hypothetical protein